MPFKTWNIIEHKREIQKGRTKEIIMVQSLRPTFTTSKVKWLYL